jgi:hypothetical protein
MRIVTVIFLAMVLVPVSLESGLDEAVAAVASRGAITSAQLDAGRGALEQAYWVRRCDHRGCRRWWVHGPGFARGEGCRLWRATHWGLRRAWVC